MSRRYRRVEALHYDTLQGPREGFEAKRITVTATDGTEMGRVVWIDKSQSKALAGVATKALGEAVSKFGDEAGQAFLAMIADHVLGDEDVDEEVDTLDTTTERRVRHA
jgi:hypothetical protein